MRLGKALLLLLLPASPLAGESLTTEPIGFNKVICLANSDTIVGVPLRAQGSITAKLAAVPAVNGDVATLTLSDNALPALGTHYLKFNGGTHDGRWYDITNNTADSITIDLNGDNLDGMTGDESVLIAEYWTLDTLFPPDKATTGWTAPPEGSDNWLPNGHAIVASSNTSLRNRRTQLLIPDTSSEGINFSALRIFYITNSQWHDASTNQPVDSGFALMPDYYFTISHPSTIEQPTVFRSTGEVVSGNFSVPLRSLSSGSQDNYVAIPRPIDLRLDQLNLYESGAFVASANTSLRNRKDQLMLYDNEFAIRNRSASAIFYHDGITWLDSADNSDASDRIIPASAGFVIRKARTDVDSTSFWHNTPIYD